MTAADEQQMQAVFRREYRSLLQYVRGAAPYAAAADRTLLAGVQRVAAEEAAAIQALGDCLEAHRVPLPQLGAFPVAFTDLNFVGIRYLLPRLIAEQKRDTAALDADGAAVTDPAARAAVRQLADVHRRHLAEMEQLGT